MKKSESIVFDVNFSDFENKGKADRFFALYKQLRRNRELRRFCREAFMEKAQRYLGGAEEQHAELQKYIKSRGIGYVLDSLREKENPQPALVLDQTHLESLTEKIIEVLRTKLPHSEDLPEPDNQITTLKAVEATESMTIHEIEANPLSPPHKPNMEKLKALL
ncbi:hypothetical protein [Ammoniphilus sp. YIM 78166]|uniref:hypothetical protein n=1 Tax=Ammoniphilus sp. YIM 78166 TaxID=1644106 RepID=UPI001070091C|nr:hypothetical protein [Ammoniphilus sp. YIM 78166]